MYKRIYVNSAAKKVSFVRHDADGNIMHLRTYHVSGAGASIRRLFDAVLPLIPHRWRDGEGLEGTYYDTRHKRLMRRNNI